MQDRWPMRWTRRIALLIFPERASTQMWMFLTLMLLVTVSVACVALYVLFIHGTQVRDAAQQAYVMQADRIAHIIDEAGADSAQVRSAMSLARAVHVHIVMAEGDSIRWSQAPTGFISAVTPDGWPEILQRLHNGGQAFLTITTPSGARRVVLASTILASGGTVYIERPESPLHAEARRSRWTLLLGMIMALAMAMVSSWVMADKVTTPLQAISRSAKEITAGELDTPIRVATRSAEIQDLAIHLDRMTVSYREKISELEKLTRLQGEFIGNVAHEVRNPLFSVSGYLEALALPNLDRSKREHFVAKGLKNLQRLGNLFENLIEIARLEYREDLIEASNFNFADLTQEVADMLGPKAEDKGLVLTLRGPALSVCADRDRIRRVLVNLIENAIVYSDQGTITCRWKLQDDKVRIEVSDQGRGISAVHQERIFDRFVRVEPDRSRQSGGAGLGLSIVKQILQAHKEPIHLASAPGKGTRFWFALPPSAPPAKA